MATHWRDMEKQFWEYLNRQPSYTTLGLREYKG